MPTGPFSPLTKAALTKAPEVEYSEIVPEKPLVRNKFVPSVVIPLAPFNPVIRDAFTTAPAVVYFPDCA